MTDLSAVAGPYWPYLLVVMAGFLPTEAWRLLGVLLGRGLDERSEILAWVRVVATTLLAGVVAKLVFSPSGALQGVPLPGRLVSLAVGIGGYFITGRSVMWGVAFGQAALVALALLFPPR
jgi:hypothetical protein